MLVTKTTAKQGDVEYETVVYLTDENVVLIYQYQFYGPEVLSTNSTELQSQLTSHRDAQSTETIRPIPVKKAPPL